MSEPVADLDQRMREFEARLCQRPTRKETACRAFRPSIGWQQTAPACSWHMTTEERDGFERARAEEEATSALYRAAWGPDYVPLYERDPACWSWSTDGIEDIYEFGAGRCAICGGRRTVLVEDHDHDTGLVRGMLCRSCNGREGNASRGVDDVWNRYRRRNPATMLGIVERYVHPITGEEDIGNIARRAGRDPLENSPAYAIDGLFG